MLCLLALICLFRLINTLNQYLRRKSVLVLCCGFSFLLPLVAGATSEGVLANFFNSLLSKKTGSPGGPGGVGGSPGGGGTGGAGSNLPPSAKKSGMINDERSTQSKLSDGLFLLVWFIRRMNTTIFN